MGKDFVVCDLETTGLSPLGDDIVEIGLVKIQKGKITDTYTTLVKHNKPLPLRISRITGLKEGDFIDSPSLDLVMPKVLSFIGDFPLIGHNVKFDADFLNANLSDELQNTLLDTLELSRLLYPMANSYRLGKMCEEVGVETKPSHRALEDAIATAELFLKLTDKLNKFD
ncbi:MAG TPA: 3'-5' exonuclease, partial [Clostridia bacterium]|nr:3'-5' exonuclease [Clostridia bacterium]